MGEVEELTAQYIANLEELHRLDKILIAELQGNVERLIANDKLKDELLKLAKIK